MGDPEGQPARGLLAAVGTTADVGPLLFDVYDVGPDCTDPVLLNGVGDNNSSAPIGVLGHEGDFSPDDRTYYATSTVGGWVTAIGLDDPAQPEVLFGGTAGQVNDGLSISTDGNWMYGVTTRELRSCHAMTTTLGVVMSGLAGPDGQRDDLRPRAGPRQTDRNVT